MVCTEYAPLLAAVARATWCQVAPERCCRLIVRADRSPDAIEPVAVTAPPQATVADVGVAETPVA
ncbi:hypothetical protein GCM10025868_27630 [Angustibacter aerolatus]|uniref:Uncharacterized protein n=1 Tax=Angustibacter aerolatus TaxID=1162965 RepID=A0ABQ6JJB5_9ACTN|nr:hypothetical protein GCM10025868_27630 [Angustibacter aerolatus]